MHARLSPAWPDPGSDSRSPVVLLLHGLGSNENDLPSLAPWLPDGLAWASLRAPVEMEWGGATLVPSRPPRSSPSWRESPLRPRPSGVGWTRTFPRTLPSCRSASPRAGSWRWSYSARAPNGSAATVVLSGLMSEGERPTDARTRGVAPAGLLGQGYDRHHDLAGSGRSPRRLAPSPRRRSPNASIPGSGTAINDDELDDVRAFLDAHLT